MNGNPNQIFSNYQPDQNQTISHEQRIKSLENQVVALQKQVDSLTSDLRQLRERIGTSNISIASNTLGHNPQDMTGMRGQSGKQKSQQEEIQEKVKQMFEEQQFQKMRNNQNPFV